MVEQKQFSIFVNNIPDAVDPKWLFEIFEKCGKVSEVFIPNNKNKGGRRYGFVRYQEKKSAEVAIQTFNRVWFMHHRLGVNMARFERGMVPTKDFGKEDTGYQIVGSPIACSQSLDGNKTGQVFGRSFAEALIGPKTNIVKRVESQPKDTIKSCLGTVNGELTEILKTSVVGITMKRMEGYFLKECFIREGVFDIEIRPISDRVFLLTFEDCGVLKTMEEDGWIWLRSWFARIEHWNDKFLVPPRCSWLQCSGVPVLGWSKDTFNSIGGLWGSLICTAMETKKCKQFQHGFILVAIDVEERVDETIEVVVNGCACRVKVKELGGDPIGALVDLDVKPKTNESTTRDGEGSDPKLNMEESLRANEVVLEPRNEESVGCYMASFKGEEKEYAVQLEAHVSESRMDMGVNSNIDGSAQLVENVGSHSNSNLQSLGGASNLRCETVDKGVRVNVNDSVEPTILLVPETPTFVLKGGEDEDEASEHVRDASGDFGREGDLSDSGESVWETDEESEDVTLAVMKSRIKEARLKKSVGRRKAMDLIFDSCGEGIRWFNKGNTKENKALKRSTRRNDMLSMNEACSLLEAGTMGSISEEGSRNRNDMIIEEARETWKVGKALGLTYDGEEGEIISRLMELERRDWVEYERCQMGG